MAPLNQWIKEKDFYTVLGGDGGFFPGEVGKKETIEKEQGRLSLSGGGERYRYPSL